MKWIKKRPDKEGWYFWRKARTITDPWKWNAYFVTVLRLRPRLWEIGCETHWPSGGWWTLAYREKKEKKGRWNVKLSQKTRDELYKAIHDEIMSVRIKLKLSPKDDVMLAQIEHTIWAKQKRALKLPGYI